MGRSTSLGIALLLVALAVVVNLLGHTHVVIGILLVGVAGLTGVRCYRQLHRRNAQLEEVSDALITTTDLAHREHLRADNVEQAQEQFFGAMVHQLKTPLTVIRGYAEITLVNWDELTDDKKKSYLDRILEGTKTMNSTIETDLEIIRNNCEGWRADCTSIDDLSDHIASMVRDLSVQFKNVEFWWSDIESPIHADERVLKIVLEHLVENAHTHGLEGQPIIVSLAEHRRCVELSVSGKGPVDRERLDDSCFQRGYRSRHSGGSGLGLWIVKNYIQSMAGDINVSQLDYDHERITTFMVNLPKSNKVDIINDTITSQEPQYDNAVRTPC